MIYSDEKDYVQFLFDSGVIISNEELGNTSPITEKVLLDQNWDKINLEYSSNNCVVIDNFLKPEIITRLRDFVLYINKRHDYYGEYAAVNFHPKNNNTFWFPILSNIVLESKEQLNCLSKTQFNRGWAFIYNEICSGIPIHADEHSDVTLNLWVTPDECLLSDDNHNGLIVYDQNKVLVIPYQFNRMVVFKSKRLHKSQDVLCKSGYKNKRINFAFLFENA